jgi:hypothetical protein
MPKTLVQYDVLLVFRLHIWAAKWALTKRTHKYFNFSMFTFIFFIYKFYDINLVGKNWLPAKEKGEGQYLSTPSFGVVWLSSSSLMIDPYFPVIFS